MPKELKEPEVNKEITQDEPKDEPKAPAPEEPKEPKEEPLKLYPKHWAIRLKRTDWVLSNLAPFPGVIAQTRKCTLEELKAAVDKYLKKPLR